MRATRLLAFSRADKKLYVRTPGAAWEEFAVQPPISAGVSGGAMCCGLSDGSIIVLDSGAWIMWHWDPATEAWINRGHPGTMSQWSVCVQAGSADAVAMSNLGNVATFSGSTQTWSLLASPGGSAVMDVAEYGTLTDIWITMGMGGATGPQHYDGASWTDLRAAIVAAIPTINPSIFYRITRCADGTIFTVCTQSGAFPGQQHLIKRSPAGTWSLCGSWGADGARGLWAADSTHVWMSGPGAYGNDDYLWFWNGIVISGVRTLHVGAASWAGTKALHGIDAQRVICCSGNIEIYETIDGVNWPLTDAYPGADVAQFGTLWLEEVAPTIENESPGAGARWTEPRGWVEFDALDAGGSGIDVAETVVTIDGATAWIADALGSGFEGARTATADGYHYKLRRATWPRPSAPTIVSVAIADLAANTATKTWIFTEWGADARAQEYIRVMDGLLPPGAFGGEA
jgi:hypothetical protein